jgi:hypothetical protein
VKLVFFRNVYFSDFTNCLGRRKSGLRFRGIMRV